MYKDDATATEMYKQLGEYLQIGYRLEWIETRDRIRVSTDKEVIIIG